MRQNHRKSPRRDATWRQLHAILTMLLQCVAGAPPSASASISIHTSGASDTLPISSSNSRLILNYARCVAVFPWKPTRYGFACLRGRDSVEAELERDDDRSSRCSILSRSLGRLVCRATATAGSARCTHGSSVADLDAARLDEPLLGGAAGRYAVVRLPPAF